MTPWLRLRDLQFSRKGRSILHNISLDLSPGELILLTGPNGSGKTTLLRIIAGLLAPDHALLDTRERKQLNWRSCSPYLRAQSCYLHQQPYLFDTSVYDNIAYGLKCRKLQRAKIEARVREGLERASLEHLAQRHSRELSGGEQQRVAMLRAWVLAPRLMLLDEPVANMDKLARQQCLSLINELQQDKIGVILTSHEPQQGKLNITRHLHLYQGEMMEKPLAKQPVNQL